MKRGIVISILIVFYAAIAIRMGAQDVESLLKSARRMMSLYEYEQADSCYALASRIASDSLQVIHIEEEKAICDSAQAQTIEVPILDVVARARFSRKDFFLYYPLPDYSFRPIEGSNDVIYYPSEADQLFISADEDNKNCLFPMTIENKMYFSTDSLGGFGGYDLFCREGDESLGEWKEPYNVGFPYSSSGDDFLFMETDDGLYNIFASNRFCSKDSVYVYVIEKKDHYPMEKILTPSERQNVSKLNPNAENGSLVAYHVKKVDPWAEKYQNIIEEERELLSAMRNCTEEERISYQEELENLTEAKAQVEEYIFRNNIQTRSISAEVDREVAGVEGSFIFLKRNIGKPIKITYIK